MVRTADGRFWRYSFRIGKKVITGSIEANLKLLAERKIRMRIDRQMKELNDQSP